MTDKKGTDEEFKMICVFMGWREYNEQNYWVPNLYPFEGDTGETTMHASNVGFDIRPDMLWPVARKVVAELSPIVDHWQDADKEKRVTLVPYFEAIKDIHLAGQSFDISALFASVIAGIKILNIKNETNGK